MFWRGFFDGHTSRGAFFRRVHEAWLDRALSGSGRVYPRIPLRRADRGGFDPLRARPGGRARAERWWSLALGRVDAEADGGAA